MGLAEPHREVIDLQDVLQISRSWFSTVPAATAAATPVRRGYAARARNARGLGDSVTGDDAESPRRMGRVEAAARPQL